MTIIDTHLHYFPGSPEHDPETLVNSGVVTGAWILSANAIVRSTPQVPYVQASDEEVIDLCRGYPDFLIPFGYLDFDEAGPERIDWLYEQGCIGLKAIWPGKAYDDPSHFPYYERADHYGMPILFHVGGSPYWAPDRVSIDPAKREWSKYMTPMTLDGVAKTFPNLPLIMAHLGGGVWDHDLAFYLTRGHPNMYIELSVSEGYLDKVKEAGRSPTLAKKLLFGTDGSYPNSVGRARFWEGFFRYVVGSEEVCRLVMGENAERIIAEARSKRNGKGGEK